MSSAFVRFVHTSIIMFIILLYTGIVNAQEEFFPVYDNMYLDSLENVLQTDQPEGEELANILSILIYGYREIDIDKVMVYSRRLITLTEGTEYVYLLPAAYEGLGVAHYLHSSYDSAMVYYNKALEAAELMRKYRFSEMDIDDVFAVLYGQIANVYDRRGQHDVAISYFFKALELFEKHDIKQSLSHTYAQIGYLYTAMGNYEQAEINFLKSEAIAREIPDSSLIAIAKNYLSQVSLYNKNFDKALEEAEEAYSFFIAHSDAGSFIIPSLMLLSEVQLKGYNNTDKAEEYIREALKMEETINSPYHRAVSLRMLSQIHLQRGRWREAEQTALEALAVDDTEPPNTMELYEVLIKSYAKLGNSDNVWEYFNKHNELKSSFSNKNYQSTISEMEVRYDTEKKELRITALEDRHRMTLWLGAAGLAVLLLVVALFVSLWRWTALKKRASEQKVKQLEQEKQLVATQAVLDGETAERARLARDLHDGLGGKLTVMKLNLEELKQGAQLDAAAMAQFDRAMVTLNDSVTEMRRVSHNLMPDTLSRKGLKPAVDDLCRSMSPMIVFNYYGTESRLDPKLEVLIYRCIHELVNNALKYADATQIMVQIIQEDDSVSFTVQDDGRGFDPATVTDGTGLQNIRTRVASFGGEIQIDSKAGEGTEVDVSLRR
jgi:Signal transduction histidine kinase